MYNHENTFRSQHALQTRANGETQDNPKAVSSNVYPNPANDIINFELGDVEQINISVKIFDAIGNIVLSISIKSNEPVSVSTLSPGIYLYKISGSGEEIENGKFAIIR